MSENVKLANVLNPGDFCQAIGNFFNKGPVLTSGECYEIEDVRTINGKSEALIITLSGKEKWVPTFYLEKVDCSADEQMFA